MATDTQTRSFAEALAAIRAIPLADLREMISESHKDIHGVRGHWAFTSEREELLNWWTTYFTWDEAGQFWTSPDID